MSSAPAHRTVSSPNVTVVSALSPVHWFTAFVTVVEYHHVVGPMIWLGPGVPAEDIVPVPGTGQPVVAADHPLLAAERVELFAAELAANLLHDAVLGKAYRCCSHPTEPEDLFQDALVHALENAKSFKGHSRPQFVKWFHTIVRQKVAALFRKAPRRACDALPADLPGPDETPENVLMQAERVAWLLSVLPTLKPADRHLLLRHHVDGLKFATIGKEMQRNSKALPRRDRVLLDRLKKLWENY